MTTLNKIRKAVRNTKFKQLELKKPVLIKKGTVLKHKDKVIGAYDKDMYVMLVNRMRPSEFLTFELPANSKNMDPYAYHNYTGCNNLAFLPEALIEEIYSQLS